MVLKPLIPLRVKNKMRFLHVFLVALIGRSVRPEHEADDPTATVRELLHNGHRVEQVGKRQQDAEHPDPHADVEGGAARHARFQRVHDGHVPVRKENHTLITVKTAGRL
ncbi:hypothetical protein CDAR_402411 [Caerostris darwini]|uniref:Secreted protein n=1 Tax=Caerostris darwini TaxID=1538125 RepID=A0AAV4VMJ4_9ARAC|nr:hypothetical protein CDAR_402411 [Caerostris darwini]